MSNVTRNIQKKIGLREKARNLTDDVANLRKDLGSLKEVIDNIVTGINSSLGSHPKRLSVMEEMVGAVIDLSGFNPQDVLSKIKDNRLKIAKEQFEMNQKAIETAVTNGDMLVSDTIDEYCLICGIESDPNGNPIDGDTEGNAVFQGNVEFESSKVDSKIFSLLKDKKTGDVVKFDNGGTFLVKGIYKANPDKVQKVVQQSIEEVTKTESSV